MSITADELYAKYEKTITRIIAAIQKDKEAAIPGIIAAITTEIIPAMMSDVGRVKSLGGTEKRELILETIELAIKKTFKELNKIPELAAASWDETLRDLLLTLVPPLIKLLISVENNEIKFNKKVSGCFSCCTKS